MARHKPSSQSEQNSQEAVDTVLMEEPASVETTEDTAVETTVSMSIVETVKAGASAAEDAASRVIPAIGENLRKAAYTGIYCAAFGVTFGALAIARLVPPSSFVGHAIVDGAAAAREAYRKRQEAEEAPMEADLEPASA